MLDLTTLSRPKDLMALQATTEKEFQDNGFAMLPDFDQTPFSDRLREGSPYSSALTDLIKKCLVVDPAKRLPAKTLKQDTEKYLKSCLEKRNDDPKGVDNWKLYYHNNNINETKNEPDMCDFHMEAYDLLALSRLEQSDPDDPDLELSPSRLWKSTNDADAESQERKLYDQKLNQINLDDRYYSQVRAQLGDGEFGSSTDDNFWFKDQQTFQDRNNISDSYSSRDNGPGIDGRIKLSGLIMDLSKDPGIPRDPYGMFVEFRANEEDTELPQAQMLREWKRLSPQQRHVFEALHRRAQRYHEHHLEGQRKLQEILSQRMAERTGRDLFGGDEPAWRALSRDERQKYTDEAKESNEKITKAWKRTYGQKPEGSSGIAPLPITSQNQMVSARAIWKLEQRKARVHGSVDDATLNAQWAGIGEAKQAEWYSSWLRQQLENALRVDRERVLAEIDLLQGINPKAQTFNTWLKNQYLLTDEAKGYTSDDLDAAIHEHMANADSQTVANYHENYLVWLQDDVKRAVNTTSEDPEQDIVPVLSDEVQQHEPGSEDAPTAEEAPVTQTSDDQGPRQGSKGATEQDTTRGSGGSQPHPSHTQLQTQSQALSQSSQSNSQQQQVDLVQQPQISASAAPSKVPSQTVAAPSIPAASVQAPTQIQDPDEDQAEDQAEAQAQGSQAHNQPVRRSTRVTQRPERFQ